MPNIRAQFICRGTSHTDESDEAPDSGVSNSTDVPTFQLIFCTHHHPFKGSPLTELNPSDMVVVVRRVIALWAKLTTPPIVILLHVTYDFCDTCMWKIGRHDQRVVFAFSCCVRKLYYSGLSTNIAKHVYIHGFWLLCRRKRLWTCV